MPGHRASNAEIADRVELCRSLLLRRLAKYTIKAAFRAKYGKASARVIEFYLARARAILLVDLEQAPKRHRASSLAFYESVVSDPNATDRDKLKAAERIDKLLGLEAPVKLQHGNDPDNPLPVPILRIVESDASEGSLNGHHR